MKHVLVVDDEAEIRSSLEEILREEGYGVATAENAADAMMRLEDAPYDVVLLDIWLPDRAGLDVRRRHHDAHPVHVGEATQREPLVLDTVLRAHDGDRRRRAHGELVESVFCRL